MPMHGLHRRHGGDAVPSMPHALSSNSLDGTAIAAPGTPDQHRACAIHGIDLAQVPFQRGVVRSGFQDAREAVD